MFHVILRKDFDVNRPKGIPVGIIENDVRAKQAADRAAARAADEEQERLLALQNGQREAEDLHDHPHLIMFMQLLGALTIQHLHERDLSNALLGRCFLLPAKKRRWQSSISFIRNFQEYAYWDVWNKLVLRSDGVLFKEFRPDYKKGELKEYIPCGNSVAELDEAYRQLRNFIHKYPALHEELLLTAPGLAEFAANMSERRQKLLNLPERKSSILSILSSP